MLPTSTKARKISAPAPKPHGLDAHHWHNPEENSPQGRLSPGETQPKFSNTQIGSRLRYPSQHFTGRRTSTSIDLPTSQLGASSNTTQPTWKRSKCEDCGRRETLHRVAKPATQYQPAAVQASLREVETGYRQFLRGNRLVDKEVPSVPSNSETCDKEVDMMSIGAVVN